MFLVTVALIAGMVGCGQPAEYTPMVAAGGGHTVGLKTDGTVDATGGGAYDYGQCDVGGWGLN